MNEIRTRFHYLNKDPDYHGNRLYFDNGAGSLRLKKAIEVFSHFDAFPNDIEKGILYEAYKKGLEDIRTIFNAQEGSIITEISASQVMFKMTETIIKNVPGTNVVVTEGDHPSSFDAATIFSKEYKKELRIAKTNNENGGTNVDDIIKNIDKNTCLLSIIYASNISGAVLDIKTIINEARKINPDLYIIVDGVQFAPHSSIDVNALKIDGINFAPYKFFSNRGIGFGYVSNRMSMLPHQRLIDAEEKSWMIGSPVVGSFAAITEVVNYVCWIGEKFISNDNRRRLFEEGMKRINLHEKALMNEMLEGNGTLKGIRYLPNINIYFDSKNLNQKEFLIAMRFDNLSVEKSKELLDKNNIVVAIRSHDSLFAKRQLNSFGVKDFLRITPMHYNSQEDINDFLKKIAHISKQTKNIYN